VTIARPGSRIVRITAVPISVSDAENNVTMPSLTSESRAWTSLVRREITTPVLLRE
jgi:hypothetical protein